MNVDEGIRYLIWKQEPMDPIIKNDLERPEGMKESDWQKLQALPKVMRDEILANQKKPDQDPKAIKIPTVMKEYVLVKKMLINNALPIGNQYSHKLIIDKKVLYNMMLDLQRFRKLLLLKKSFFIFQHSYAGKPEKDKPWHDKVEERITQTFMLMNMRRVINIIGYDPSNYFKGEMSFANVENIRKGNVPDGRTSGDG